MRSKRLTWPGSSWRMKDSCGTQKPWMTSRETPANSISTPVGTSAGRGCQVDTAATATPPGYSKRQLHCAAMTLTRSAGWATVRSSGVSVRKVITTRNAATHASTAALASSSRSALLRRPGNAGGGAKSRYRHQLGDSPAAGDVCLHDVDRARLQHAPEVEEVVAVLPGGDLHAGRRPVAQQPQALQVIGGDRLLEPADG